jgi:hypothetical protein
MLNQSVAGDRHGVPTSVPKHKLAAAVRDRWPPVQILITSGKHPEAALPEGMPFLPKPYRIDKLCRTVEAFSLF